MENKIYSDHLDNRYQMALRELKKNNANLQENFELLSKVVEDEWKDNLVYNESTTENNPVFKA